MIIINITKLTASCVITISYTTIQRYFTEPQLITGIHISRYYDSFNEPSLWLNLFFGLILKRGLHCENFGRKFLNLQTFSGELAE